VTSVVDFNMIVEINKLLKDNNIDYSLHSIGSCASCGMELKQNGEVEPIENIIDIINNYLSSKWLKVIQSEENQYILYAVSKFDFKE